MGKAVTRSTVALAAGAIAITLLAACGASSYRPLRGGPPAQRLARAPRIIMATPPPPAPPDIPETSDPGAGYVWRPGHYTFRGGRYVWNSGAWVLPPQPGLEWIPGFYQRTPEGGVWVVGHWRKPRGE
jgi:hypothetical protein